MMTSFKALRNTNTPLVNTILAISLFSTVALTGCATTGNISPQYVPPSTYTAYDCTDLSQELGRIDNYIEKVQSQQSTLTATGVGVGISAGRWGISPNITFGVGKSNNKRARDANLSRLYGEKDAVIQSARLKQCAFSANLKTYGE